MEFITAIRRRLAFPGSPGLASSDSGKKAFFRKHITIGTKWNVIPSFYKTINSILYHILVRALRPHTIAEGNSKVITWVFLWEVFIVTVIVWLSFNVVEDVRLVGAGDHLGLGEMLVALDNELGLVALLQDIRDVLSLGMPITPLAIGISR